jgi:hypothetical protein
MDKETMMTIPADGYYWATFEDSDELEIVEVVEGQAYQCGSDVMLDIVGGKQHEYSYGAMNIIGEPLHPPAAITVHGKVLVTPEELREDLEKP